VPGQRRAGDDSSKPDPLGPLLRFPRSRQPLWKRVLYFIGAALAFALGIVGWLLPVVTGIPFYILGLLLLAKASDRTVKWINRAEAKLPPRRRRQLRALLKKIPSRWLQESLRAD
jgi:hypothetical protein